MSGVPARAGARGARARCPSRARAAYLKATSLKPQLREEPLLREGRHAFYCTGFDFFAAFGEPTSRGQARARPRTPRTRRCPRRRRRTGRCRPVCLAEYTTDRNQSLTRSSPRRSFDSSRIQIAEEK